MFRAQGTPGADPPDGGCGQRAGCAGSLSSCLSGPSHSLLGRCRWPGYEGRGEGTAPCHSHSFRRLVMFPPLRCPWAQMCPSSMKRPLHSESQSTWAIVEPAWTQLPWEFGGECPVLPQRELAGPGSRLGAGAAVLNTPGLVTLPVPPSCRVSSRRCGHSPEERTGGGRRFGSVGVLSAAPPGASSPCTHMSAAPRLRPSARGQVNYSFYVFQFGQNIYLA